MKVAASRGNHSSLLLLPCNGTKQQSIECFKFHRSAQASVSFWTCSLRFHTDWLFADFPGGLQRIANVLSRNPPQTQSTQLIATRSLQLPPVKAQDGVRVAPPTRQKTKSTPSSTAIVETGDKIGICCSTRQKENTLGRRNCRTFAAVQHSNRWRGAGCRTK